MPSRSLPASTAGRPVMLSIITQFNFGGTCRREYRPEPLPAVSETSGTYAITIHHVVHTGDANLQNRTKTKPTNSMQLIWLLLQFRRAVNLSATFVIKAGGLAGTCRRQLLSGGHANDALDQRPVQWCWKHKGSTYPCQRLRRVVVKGQGQVVAPCRQLQGHNVRTARRLTGSSCNIGALGRRDHGAPSQKPGRSIRRPGLIRRTQRAVSLQPQVGMPRSLTSRQPLASTLTRASDGVAPPVTNPPVTRSTAMRAPSAASVLT